MRWALRLVSDVKAVFRRFQNRLSLQQYPF